jgi:iron complex transport system substrate-binding protein
LAAPASAVVLLFILVLTASLAFVSCSSSSAVAVTDLLDRAVQIDEPPVRIVTLHPTATETLYRAGGVAVGRDTSSQYPAEVLDLPTVGSAYSPSLEKVAELAPDLVIIEALTQASFVDQLEQLEVPVIAVRAASLDDVSKSLTLVAKIIDTKKTADQAIAEIQGRIDTASANAPEGKSILIFIADAEKNVYAARADSYPGAVAALLGLDNLAADLQGASPYTGFAQFTPEMALQSTPDVVFTITPAPLPAPRLSQLLPMIPGFKEMPAVKEGRVVELDPVLFLQAQGPRMADAVEELLDIVNNL